MTWMVYDAATGAVLRRVDAMAQPELREGELAFDGVLPLHGVRINPETLQVEPVALPDVGPDMQWDAGQGAFVPTPEAIARRDLIVRIIALEARQPRALREHALGQPGAAERLQDIEDQIQQLRAVING